LYGFTLEANDEYGWSTNNSIRIAKPTNDPQNWIFYGIKNDVKIVHAIQNCKYPKRTKAYKSLSDLSLEDGYSVVGYESAEYFNDHNQYIKFYLEDKLE